MPPALVLMMELMSLHELNVLLDEFHSFSNSRDKTSPIITGNESQSETFEGSLVVRSSEPSIGALSQGECQSLEL